MRKYLPFTIANKMKLSYVEHCTADFETCYTDDTHTDVKVWAWGLGNILSGDYIEGTILDSFMGHLLADNKVYDIGFHNLKFDGTFIIPYLYKNGYTYVNNTIFMEKWSNGDDMSKLFTHNITAMGQWFSVTIVKDNKYASKNVPAFIHLWDTLKLFPQTLEQVGEQYCTNYHKEKVDGDFYTRIRPDGHKLTAEESKYLKHDVMTLAEALKIQIDKYGKLFRTTASKAFNFFKEACITEVGRSNTYEMNYVGLKQHIVPKINGLEEWEGKWFMYVPLSVKVAIKNARIKMEEELEYYIPNFETWYNIKQSYRGGISYVNPLYAELDINKTITVLDENSMYPHKMATKKVPFGRMFLERGKPDESKYVCWIACARVSFKVKEPYNLPCIQMKEKYGRQWLTESTDYMEAGYASKWNDDIIWFTSVDYELYQENYDFKVHEWIEYYGFKKWGFDDGKRFVDRFYNEKQKADQIKTSLEKQHSKEELENMQEYRVACLDRQEAKVIMNSAYGKHGTKYVLLSKSSEYIDEENPVEYKAETHDFNKEPDDPSHYYCPYAAFITAYARADLVRMWNSFKGKAVYADTDSVHFIGTMEDIDPSVKDKIDWNKTGALGLWKHEGTFIKGRYIRAKTYIEVKENGTPVVTCAGATPQIKKLMDWDTFRVGFDAWKIAEERGLNKYDYSKLKPKQYPSGVALEEQNFAIKVK